MILKKRGVQVWVVCDRCGADKKDTNHILWLCPSARVVWESSPIWSLFCNSQHQNFEEVTNFIFQLDQPELQELFAILAWSLWFCRNKIRMNELDKVPHDVVSWANNFRLEFQSPKEGMKAARPNENLKWVPPPQGWFKANVDGAIFK